MRLTDLARFEIDLALPTEAWALEDLTDEQAHVLRLTYLSGYADATRDARSGRLGSLIKRLNAIQGKRDANLTGPS